LDKSVKQRDASPPEKTPAPEQPKQADKAPEPEKNSGQSAQTENSAAANPADAAAIAASLLGNQKAPVAPEVEDEELQVGPKAISDQEDEKKGEGKQTDLAALAQHNTKDTAKIASAADDADRAAVQGPADRLRADAQNTPAQGLSAAGKHAAPERVDTRTDAQLSGVNADKAISQAADNHQAAHATQTFTEQLAARLNTAQKIEAPQIPVRTPVMQPGWADEVGSRMLLMTGKDLAKAELILTPPHLGRVEVSLSINGEKATAHFVTATPDAREALEQSLPRLREVMAQAGIDLSQVNISANNAGQQGAQEQHKTHRGHSGGNQGDGAQDDPNAASAMRVRASNSLVDTFA
jgi:flagellar hook-length control protein FliK